MLTRLRVSGFKNLVDVDVSFVPFTCIAGTNGVGKSNLLDAIVFLSALADRPLLDAALSVRDQGAKTGDIRGLFHHAGDHFDDEMSFVAEMIIPMEGADDLGQHAKTTATFVEYSIKLRYRHDPTMRALGSLELVSEDLKYITLGEAAGHLPFEPSRAWRKSVIDNKRRGREYISTKGEGADRVIAVHQDGGSSGKPQSLRAANLPRTVLSAANSAESPTATLVKREMQSWKLLQLEPSALREPDNFTAPVQLASNGAHLPAMLFHLANRPSEDGLDGAAIYTEVANRLAQLLDDAGSVHVDRDERRQLLTLYATGRDGAQHPARALSDGTLRFLALTVLAIDPEARGVICMEEPENGLHPERIPAMIQLLSDLATNIKEAVSADSGNPLRQVIVNTHSPSVVMQVPEESLILAEPVEVSLGGRPSRTVQFRCLPGTWRAKAGSPGGVSKGRLLAYLNPVAHQGRGGRRVVDREDIRQYRIPVAAAGD
ncbi:MAG: AAA family ATPase [Acidobacteria bacterium]|nr:AAA family ATPase [Acidobacteriota bacterium]